MSITVTHYRRIRIKRRRELGRGKYAAKQVKDEVIVTAAGETPTPNYKVWLQFGPEKIFPPIIELWWMPPTGVQIQVMTPFQVHTTFRVGDKKIDKIQVRDADGMHEIEVQHEDGDVVEPEDPLTAANNFRLALPDGTPVSFAATSFIGEPIMSVGKQHFIGDELLIEDTALGHQVTVVLEQVPDLKVVTFSLILPQVLLQTGKPVEVSVPGVTATHHTTIAGPPPGQGTTYEQAMLEGIAEVIVA